MAGVDLGFNPDTPDTSPSARRRTYGRPSALDSQLVGAQPIKRGSITLPPQTIDSLAKPRELAAADEEDPEGL